MLQREAAFHHRYEWVLWARPDYEWHMPLDLPALSARAHVVVFRSDDHALLIRGSTRGAQLLAGFGQTFTEYGGRDDPGHLVDLGDNEHVWDHTMVRLRLNETAVAALPNGEIRRPRKEECVRSQTADQAHEQLALLGRSLDPSRGSAVEAVATSYATGHSCHENAAEGAAEGAGDGASAVVGEFERMRRHDGTIQASHPHGLLSTCSDSSTGAASPPANLSRISPPYARRPFALPFGELNERRVALLMMGDAFRTGGSSGGNACNMSRSSLLGQRDATNTHIRNLVRPLEAHASVHTLLVLNRCPQATASYQQAVASTLCRWYRSAGASATSSVVDSPDMSIGWKRAHQLLIQLERQQGGPFDFVLQARHDIALEKPLNMWPADFTRLLFERECLECDGGCGCNGRGHFLANRNRSECQLCTTDHLIWAPARFMPVLRRAIISRGVSGHAVLRNILSHEALDVGHDVGYMFPDRCDAFPLALPCTEIGAYRPLRLDRDTGGPPAMPDWTEWERAFDPNDGGSAVGWHARVRKMHMQMHRTPKMVIT